MARPTGIVGNKRPNTTAVRVQPETIDLITEVHRIVIGGNSTHPLGDKLKSILLWAKGTRKKEEALEGEIRELSNLLAKQYGFEENKPLVIAQ